MTGTRALCVATNHGVLDIGVPTGVFGSELTVPYYVFLDAGPYLDHPGVTRMIREISFDHAKNGITMFFVGSRVALHPDIQRMSASFRMSAIGPDEVRALIKEEADLYMYQRESNIKADRAAYERHPERPDPFWSQAEAWTEE